MDRDKMSNLYRGPSIDASYPVSVHLAKGFQRRRLKCEKLMNDRRQTPSDGKSSHCLWQGELTMGIICGAGNAYPSVAPEFAPGFLWSLCCWSIFSFLSNVLQIIVCRFVIFLLAIVLFVYSFRLLLWYLQNSFV